MKSKKILTIVNNVWPPPVLITGISIMYACQIESSKLGNEVHILTSTGLWDKDSQKSNIDDLYNVEKWFENEEKNHNIKFHTYNMSMFSRFPRLGFYINRIMPFFIVPFLHMKYRFDVVHEYTSTPLLIWRTFIFKKLFGVSKAVHTIVAGSPYFIGSHKMLSKVKPHIDKIICTNNRIYNNFKSIGYPTEELINLSLGVDGEKFKTLPDKKLSRKKYNILPEKYIFLFLAPLEHHKGPDIFAEAAKQLLKQSNSPNDVLFLIATYESPGKRHYKERKGDIQTILKNYEDNYKIIEGIFDVPELLALADAVVFPQRTFDGATGHPVTLLEAMLSECLVIGSDLAGINDLVDGKNGYLFKLGSFEDLTDKMLHAYSHEHQIAPLKHAAKELIKDRYLVSSIAKVLNNKVYE